MKLGTLALAVLAAAVTATAVRAQRPAARMPATLTLEDAIRIARESNPDYRKALNDVDVAAAQVRRGWGAFLPGLSTSLNFSGGSSTTFTGQNDFGQPVGQERAITFRSSSASQNVGLNFTLFDGGSMFRDLAAAHAAESAAEVTTRMQRAALDASVSRQYFAARRADMLAAVERRNLATARDRLERSEQMFRIAGATQVDLLGAQQDVVRAERQLAAAENEARKARLQLAETLGVDGDIAFEFGGELPEPFDASTLDGDGLVAEAVRSSPTVLQREAAFEQARHTAAAARGARWPQVTAGFSYRRSVNEQGYGAFGDLTPRDYGYGFSVGVSLPLFSRFQTSASIAAAAASEEDADHDVRKARLQIEREVRSGLVDLEDAYRGLLAADEIARITALRAELADERYRSGAMDFLQLQTVINEDANARRQAVDARFAFLTARVALEERLGAPVRR